MDIFRAISTTHGSHISQKGLKSSDGRLETKFLDAVGAITVVTISHSTHLGLGIRIDTLNLSSK